MTPDEIRELVKRWKIDDQIYIHDFNHPTGLSYVVKDTDDMDEEEAFFLEYFDRLSEPEIENEKPYQPPEPEEVEEKSFFEIILQEHK